MAININTNVGSIQANNGMNKTNSLLQKSLAKLASGKRINSAMDDAAGLAISEELSAQIRSLSQAERNTMDGVSMVQTAEGALNQSGESLSRMRELAIQSANGTLSDEDREHINSEMNALKEEINRVAGTTEFNGTKLLDGSAGGIPIQTGTGAESSDRIQLDIGAMDTSNLGTASATVDSVTTSTASGARHALSTIDAAISDISATRADLGAKQNALNMQRLNLANQRENLTAANSRIRDLDVAAETAQLVKNQILMQSGTAVAAQANQLPGMALSLIG